MSPGAADLWADVPLGAGVRVLSVDGNGLAALAKPEGILSHPNGPRDVDRSLVRAPYDKAEECFGWTAADGRPRRIWLVNRLDSATSGLILASADGAVAREVRAQFQRRRVRKVYQALVFGKPRQPAEAWRDVLGVSRRGGRIRTAAGAGGLPAECRMTLVRSGPGRLSLVRLEPQTGRSHQLRVQCAKRGLPIVGDQTYGDFGANRAFVRAGGPKRMFLHSQEIALDYEFGGRRHAFSAQAPLPAEFERPG
ncbi:MAG TPA: RNA pseudouridine synthase [Opitutaceae bacterium]|nr:RNA pseudouridine synthase [Opitutaceae bacterium]